MPTDDNPVVVWEGDCLALLPRIPAGAADAVVTDPPYGIGEVMKRSARSDIDSWNKLQREANWHPWDFETAKSELLLALSMVRHAVVWGGNYYPLPPQRGWLIWDKIVRQFSTGHCEMAWTTLNQPVRAFNYSHGQLANERKEHPTQKPLPLMQWCIRQLPSDCRTILDPFAGSGTTGVAAALEGRKCILIEKDPHYAAIARRRVAEVLGQNGLFRDVKPTQPAGLFAVA